MSDNIEVGNLQAKISVDDTEANKSLADLQRSVRVAGSEFKKTSVEVEGFGKGTDGLKAKSDALTKQINTQMKFVNKLREEHEKSTQTKGKDARETQNLEVRYNKAATELAKMETDLKKTNSELEKQTTAWERVGKRLDETTEKMKSFGQKAAQVGRDMTVAITTPLALIGGAAFKAANDVDNAMAIIKTSTGATGDVLKGLENDLTSVYSTIPTNANDAAGAIANLNTLLGASGPALQDLSKQILEVSRMMKEDGVSNSHAFGKAIEQWEIPVENASLVMDKLFKVTQDTGIGFGELTGTLNTYGPVMKNAGFTIEETAELMGRMNAAGIAWSRISPGLNKSFRDWAAAGKEPRVELERTFEAMKNAQTEAEALNIAVGIFGSDGAQRLTAGVRQGALSLEGLGDALRGIDGLIAETAGETMTFADELRVLKNEVEANIAPIGSSLIKALKDVLTLAQPMIDGIGRMAEGFSELDESTQKSIITWGLVVAAIGPGILTFGKLTTAIVATTTGVKALSAALAKLMLNPYIAGFAALAGMAVLVANHFRIAKRETEELRKAQEELQRVQNEGIERHEIDMYVEKIQVIQELRDTYLKLAEAMESARLIEGDPNLENKALLELNKAAKRLDIDLGELNETARKFGIELKYIDENGKIAATSLEDLESITKTYTTAIDRARRETTAELNEQAKRIAMQNNEIDTMEALLNTYREAKRDTDEWHQAQSQLARMFPQFADGVEINTEAIEGLLIVKREETAAAWESIQVKAQEIIIEKQRELATREAAIAAVDAGAKWLFGMENAGNATKLAREEVEKLKAEILSLQSLVDSDAPTYTPPPPPRPYVFRSSQRAASSRSSTASERYANEALDEAYKQLEHKKRLDQLTLDSELRLLEQIKSEHVKTADERMAIEERLYDVRKRLAERSKDDESRLLDEATRQYKTAVEDKIFHEELSAEEQFKAQESMYDNIIQANKDYLARVLADERYTSEEQEQIQKRITEVIRSNVNDRLRLQQSYYDGIRQQEIDNINELSGALQNALRQKLENERDKMEESFKDELEDIETARKKQLEAITDVYKEKDRQARLSAEREIAEIERVHNYQIQMIQDELNALDRAETERTRAELDSEDELKLERLRALMEYERDEYNKTQLQKQINGIIANQEERHRKEQLDDHKQALREEQKTLQDSMREQIAAVRETHKIEQELRDKKLKQEIADINFLFDAFKTDLENQRTEERKHFEKVLHAKAIQAEAEKKIIENQQEEIIKLLHDFGDEYMEAGRTLGEEMYEGFKAEAMKIQTLIDNIQRQIQAARAAAMGIMGGGGGGGSSTNTTNHSVVVNQTIQTPITSPSTISRAARQSAQTLAFM